MRRALRRLTELPPIAAAIAVGLRYDELRGGQRAAGLTYITALSLVPLLATVFGVVDAVGVLDDASARLLDYLLDTYFPVASGTLRDTLSTWVVNANATYAGIVGTVIVIVAVVRLFWSVERLANDIWRCDSLKPIKARVAWLVGLVTLAPLLILASIAFSARMQLAVSQVIDIPGLSAVGSTALSMALTGVAILLVARGLTNRPVGMRPALVAAATTATLFELGKLAFYLVGRSAVTNWAGVYGALFLVPLVLFWIQWSWTFVIVGLIAGALWDERHRDADDTCYGEAAPAPDLTPHAAVDPEGALGESSQQAHRDADPASAP